MATNDKYDRQLRLWGSHGQRRLGESHILLVNAGPTGTETLKNLVLPGIGYFTVLDNKLVDEEDLGSNFFVSQDYLGQHRAKAVCELLNELNLDCQGQFDSREPNTVIEHDEPFFLNFNLIIATQLEIEPLIKLSKICENHNIPLITSHSMGFVGMFRLQLINHSIVESKPDGEKTDLRIADPFPELVAFCDKFNFGNLDETSHAHVPFVVILIQALRSWRLSHEGYDFPKNKLQKDEFKNIISSFRYQTTNEETGLKQTATEDNFDEAIKESYKAFSILSLSVEIEAEISNAQVRRLEDNAHDKFLTAFDSCLLALQEFIHRHGTLPVSGVIPDMVSTSNWFVELQGIYHTKASQDRTELRVILRSLSNCDSESVSDDFLTIFCKNLLNLQIINTGLVSDEINNYHNTNQSKEEEEEEEPLSDSQMEECSESFLESAVQDPFDDIEQTPALWYPPIRAAYLFRQQFGRMPGDMSHLSFDPVLEEQTYNDDVTAVWSLIQKITKGVITPLSVKHAQEIVRYGESLESVHTFCSAMGGLMSQEAIKVITHQFVPVNNTYVLNGIACVGGSYEVR